MKSLVYSNIAEAYGTLNGIFSFNYFPNNHIHKTSPDWPAWTERRLVEHR